MIDVDDAIAKNEGEVMVESITGHAIEDDAYYFSVVWDDGDVTEEPLESFVDTDGCVNAKLSAYAEAEGLDLKRHIAIVVTIISGQKDDFNISSSGEESEE